MLVLPLFGVSIAVHGYLLYCVAFCFVLATFLLSVSK